MNVAEWPLTLFTILAQLAVGAFITLGVIQVVGRARFTQNAVDKMNPPALYALGPIMVLALVGSMFHLGNPFNAPNAIRHLASSWLAREILFGTGFAALGFLFALLTWKGWLSSALRATLAAFTAVWGFVFIWVMANVYLVPTIPSWDRWTTPAQFYVTTFLLGTLAMGVAYTAYPFLAEKPLSKKILGEPPSDPETAAKLSGLISATVRWIGVSAMVLLVCSLVVSGFTLMPSGSPNPPHIAFSMPLFVFRMVLLIIGAGGLGFFLNLQGSKTATGKTKTLADLADKRVLILMVSAFVLVLIAEVIGRFMFYGSLDRIGI